MERDSAVTFPKPIAKKSSSFHIDVGNNILERNWRVMREVIGSLKPFFSAV